NREAELVDLRVELSAFRLEYDTRVGRKVAELEEVEAEIKRCQQRISQYRQWGPGGPPQTRTGAAYVPVEEQYRRTWQQPEEPPSPPPAEPVDAATEAQIKKLYRQLCRRFHPDLTQDTQERAWRTEMMTAINAAYAARSLVELQALAEKPDRSPSAETGTDEQRLAALRDRLQQIQRRLREVKQESRELTNSPTMQMNLDVKFAQRQGRDLLAEMAADVEKDLARKRVELDFLVAQLKQLGIVS
ncbi:MAG: hypothetical protein GTN71_20835, partial [Anaerolineae bacterium]|nr:hypothetical protein [Anaerolineae bacterium]